MNIIAKAVDGLDRLQQRHRILALPFAVVKKYGDDSGGYQAALITYYGFLALFPLLLVLVTILQMVFHNGAEAHARVSESLSHFFPLLGDQLQQNVHSPRKTGWGLAIGLLLTLYGTRGVADVLRYTLNNIWQVPRMRRVGFPKGLLQSFLIILAAALGFVTTLAVSSFSATQGSAMWVKILTNIGGFLLLFALLMFVFRTATARRVPYKDMLIGTGFAAAITQILLTFGGLIVSHHLRNLDALYGTFAIVLGLLFWIYIIAQVLVYAAEIDSVRHLRLWPRAIQADKPTKADLQAYKLYARVSRFIPKEEIDVRFKH